MTQLVLPQTLFIDTGHLINLADLAMGSPLKGAQSKERVAAYEQIRDLLRIGRFIPIFYEPSAYEWVQGNSPQRALQIAAVLDQAVGVKRILPEPLLFTVEVMQECQRIDPRIPFPAVRIVDDIGSDDNLGAWFGDAWPEDAEKPDRIAVRIAAPGSRPTVSGVVRGFIESGKVGPDSWKLAHDGQAFSLRRTRETQAQRGGKGPVPEEVRRYLLRSFLRMDQVLHRIAPTVDVDDILARVELAACPALQLWLDAYWNYAKANETPQPGDMIDLTMFAVIPHADITLIEKRMHEFVRQVRGTRYAGQCFRDPIELVAALQ